MESTTDFDIVRTGQTEPLSIYVTNTLTNDLEDVAGTSTFSLIDISDDSTADSGTFTASGGAKITRASTGIYQYNFDADTYENEYLLAVRLTLANESVNRNIFVKSVAARQFAYAAQLRIQVDKARKDTSDELENMDRTTFEPSVHFFFGYDDKHLIYYLERGLQYLNAIPPYTSLNIDQYPFSQYGTILIDAATIAALESQGIFAIDTDYNYALGGNSLVIDHYTKLSSMVGSILARFSNTAIAWKQQYRSRGLVMFQFMPGGVRASRMLNSLPGGFWSRMLSMAYQ